MATYSINLGEEYRILDKLNDIKQYYIHRQIGDRYTKEIRKVEELEKVIINKIMEAVRIWGSKILQDPNTEFRL